MEKEVVENFEIRVNIEGVVNKFGGTYQGGNLGFPALQCEESDSGFYRTVHDHLKAFGNLVRCEDMTGELNTCLW